MQQLFRLWGHNIEDRRRDLNLKQAALAKAVGVTQQAVSAWERGEVAPSDGYKLKLAEALDCEPRDLFPLEREPAA